MAEHGLAESESIHTTESVTAEIIRLLKLVRRLEHENASLRRELAARPIAA